MKSICFFLLLFSFNFLHAQLLKTSQPKLISGVAEYLEKRNALVPLSAAIIVSKPGQLIAEKIYGYADFAAKKKIDNYTVFPIASATKPFTATAILILHDRKKLSLDDPIVKWLPSAPKQWSKIKVRHLLSHTSGLPDWQRLAPDEKIASGWEGMLDLYKKIPLQAEPGEKFSYGNVNYFLLASIIEAASATTYERFIKQSVLAPLKLQNTGFVYEYTGKKMASPYSHAFKMEQVPQTERANYRLLRGAGAMYSTPADLSVFLHGFQGLLSKGVLQEMLQPVKDDYGLGWHIQSQFGKNVIKHPGGINGYAAEVRYVLDDSLAIVILSNVRSNDLLIRYVAFDISKLMTQQTLDVPLSIDQAFIGKYNLPSSFAEKLNVSFVEIQSSNGRMTLVVPGKQTSYLVPFAKGKYFFYGEATSLEFSDDGKQMKIVSPSLGTIACKKLEEK